MLEGMNDWISVIVMSEAENVYWLHTTYHNPSTVLSKIITGGQ